MAQNSAILVAGGAGYIGSAACRALAQAGFTPVAYDNLSRGHRECVRWGPLVEGDIHDAARLRQVISDYRPVACMHFAAFAYVAESVAHPILYYRNNFSGSLILIEQLIAAGVTSVVFSSTCATYGSPTKLPIDETAEQAPINPYGRSKVMVEELLKDLDPTGMRSVSLRYFNACGALEDGSHGEIHDPEPHLVPRAILAALGKLPHLDVMGNDYPTRDGTAIRDYIHIVDLAEAHVLALRYLLGGGASEVFNLGIGRGYTVREVIESVERVSGRPVPTRIAARRAGDPPELVADSSKARRVLGFLPRYDDLDAVIETAWRWHARS